MNTDKKKPLAKAVALRYVPESQDAPSVVAKGQGYVAERIIEQAKSHGIPIQEDAPLVEVLSQLDLDEQIPAELYQLVAELLSFVYRTDAKAKSLNRGKE